MKRFRLSDLTIWTLAITLLVASVAIVYAKGRLKQYSLTATSTSPVTVSFVTTYGFQPTSLVASSTDGEFTLKFHGVGGRQGTWQKVRPGGMPVVINKRDDYPVDTLIVVPSAASGTLDVNVGGGE